MHWKTGLTTISSNGKLLRRERQVERTVPEVQRRMSVTSDCEREDVTKCHHRARTEVQSLCNISIAETLLEHRGGSFNGLDALNWKFCTVGGHAKWTRLCVKNNRLSGPKVRLSFAAQTAAELLRASACQLLLPVCCLIAVVAPRRAASTAAGDPK
eukprot:225729-Rhodomonas_salina.4